MFPVETSALINDLAREIRGHPMTNNECTISKLLYEGAVEKIISKTWDILWSKFLTFSTFSAGLMTILIMVHTIKLFIDIAIEGCVLHTVYEQSIHLLGAIQSSFTHLLLYLEKNNPYTVRYTDKMEIPQVVVSPDNTTTNPCSVICQIMKMKK